MQIIPVYPFSIILIIFFISCDIFDGDNQEIEYFTIKVDSITGPDTVDVGDTIIFSLDGYIGSNGCFMFSHFDDKKGSLESTLTVWGKHIPDEICTDAMVYLYGKEYAVKTNQSGIFRLKIKQPDNSILVDTVLVK